MTGALRRMPLPLAVAQVGAVVASLYSVIHAATMSLDRVSDRSDGTFETVLFGSSFASWVLAAVGIAWLTHRLTGIARLGARIALVAALLLIAQRLARPAVAFAELQREGYQSIEMVKAMALVTAILTIAYALGLGIATRRWYLAVLGAGVAVASSNPWFIYDRLFGSLDHDWRAMGVAASGMWLAFAITMLVLGMAACRDAESPGEVPAGPALRRAGLALYGVCAATIALVAGTLTGYDVAQAIAIEAVAVAIALVAVAALGGIRRTSELPSWLVVASAAAMLCVSGRLLLRALGLVFRAGSRTGASIGIAGPEEPFFVVATSAQVLLACAIGALLVAIAIAARRRRLDALRARTMVITGAFAALSIAAIAVQPMIGDVLTSRATLLLVGSHAALIVGWILAAIAARNASTVLAGDASLPAAKLVRG